jgi:nucleotidyltransferase/DNA polymerase involved in DNA repair
MLLPISDCRHERSKSTAAMAPGPFTENWVAGLSTEEACLAALRPLIENVADHCAARTIAGRTVTLKLRYADFTTVTRRRTVTRAIATAPAIDELVAAQLSALCPLSRGVRLLGVTLSNLDREHDVDQNGGAQPKLL